jgi:hypothetical protein
MPKLISETQGIEMLAALRDDFEREIREGYEHRAQPCSTCQTPGACCLDEHFVNVRITRLDAAAIRRRLGELPVELQRKVEERTEAVIEEYGLDRPDEYGAKTYSCPLFEKGIGCLVHDHAKPLPCINHACYDRREDLPPDELLDEREIEIEKLNQKAYGETWLVPIPIAIRQ